MKSCQMIEAQLVTYIVECIARVMAAAPYAHAVVVCRHSLLKELLVRSGLVRGRMLSSGI